MLWSGASPATGAGRAQPTRTQSDPGMRQPCTTASERSRLGRHRRGAPFALTQPVTRRLRANTAVREDDTFLRVAPPGAWCARRSGCRTALLTATCRPALRLVAGDDSSPRSTRSRHSQTSRRIRSGGWLTIRAQTSRMRTGAPCGGSRHAVTRTDADALDFPSLRKTQVAVCRWMPSAMIARAQLRPTRTVPRRGPRDTSLAPNPPYPATGRHRHTPATDTPPPTRVPHGALVSPRSPPRES
jgi:hypothetical protein